MESVLINDQPFIHLNELIVTEKLTEAMAPVKPFNRFKPGIKNENNVFELLEEPTPLQTVSLADRINEKLPQSLAFTDDQGYKLADVKAGEISLETFIAQLSDVDLATIVRGEGMCSPKVTPGTAAAFGGVTDHLLNLGIPIACAADGPSGIRMDSGHLATQIPIGTLLACTFDVDLIQELYTYEGKELVSNQIDTLLGPGINIHRHPLNGRNFEYFSEDPYLTGTMAAACLLGIRAGGSSGTLKHFACNDQETARNKTNSIVSERALREIHLKPFEMAVKKGQGVSIMTSYNPINGIWSASNYDLNTTILRGEWHYDGIVMTDWWAKMNHPVLAGDENQSYVGHMVRAQNDLFMVTADALSEVVLEKNKLMSLLNTIDLDELTIDKAHEFIGQLELDEEGKAYAKHLLASEANLPLIKAFLNSKKMKQDHVFECLSVDELTRGELQRSAMNICRFLMNTKAFNRKQTLTNETLHIKPLTSIESDEAVNMTTDLHIDTTTDTELLIAVDKSGTYNLFGSLCYDKDPLAQASFNVELNQCYLGTVQLNGTQNAVISKHLLSVQLDEGMYRLKVAFIKPGIEVKTLRLVLN